MSGGGSLVAVIPCYNAGPAVVDVIKQTREQVDGLLVVDDIAALRRAWECRLGDIVIGARTGDWTAVAWRRRWANRLSSRITTHPAIVGT